MEIKIIKQIRKLLSDAKLTEALEVFEKNLDPRQIHVANGLVILRAQWNANQNERNAGILSDDQFALVRNRIMNRALQFLHEVETPYKALPLSNINKNWLFLFALPVIGGLGYWQQKKVEATIPIMPTSDLPKIQPASQRANIQKKVSVLPESNTRFAANPMPIPTTKPFAAQEPTPTEVSTKMTSRSTTKIITTVFFMSYDKKKIRAKRIPELIQNALLATVSETDYQNVLEVTNTSDHTYIKSNGVIEAFKTEREIQSAYKELGIKPDYTDLIVVSGLDYIENNNIYALNLSLTRYNSLKSIKVSIELSADEVTLSPKQLADILLSKLNEAKFLSKINLLFKSDSAKSAQFNTNIGYLPAIFQNRTQLVVRLNEIMLKEGDFIRTINDISFNASTGKNHVEICNIGGSICKCANFNTGQSEKIYLQDCLK